MGTFSFKVLVTNPEKPERSSEVDLLVDTGSTLTKISRQTLAELDIRPKVTVRARTADNREVLREMGAAIFTVEGRTAIAPVSFGEPYEVQVLGATTLEVLGLTVDPTDHRLIPRPIWDK